MKKIGLLAGMLVFALVLTACSGPQKSEDPLVAKWALKYNEGKSQVLFNFESDGNLDIVVWHYDEEAGDLKQAEDHAGRYAVDPENGSFTYTTGGNTYRFGYELEPEKQLTVAYEDRTFSLPFIEANYVID